MKKEHGHDPKHKKEQKEKQSQMATKKVALFIQSVNDTAEDIAGETYSEVVSDLVTNSEGKFWLEENPNNVDQDLCTEIDDATESIEGNFISDATYETYQLNSVDFVGGRPPHR